MLTVLCLAVATCARAGGVSAVETAGSSTYRVPVVSRSLSGQTGVDITATGTARLVQAAGGVVEDTLTTEEGRLQYYGQTGIRITDPRYVDGQNGVLIDPTAQDAMVSADHGVAGQTGVHITSQVLQNLKQS